MEELIDAINTFAQELLTDAAELEAELDAQPDNAELDVAKISERLQRICKTLTGAIDQLERESSPLRRLVRMFGGSRVSVPLERLAQYLADHRATLIRLRVPEAAIERTLAALRDEASAGSNALDKPQTLTIDAALQPLKTLRDLICNIAHGAEIAQVVATPALLRQIVVGTVGAATILVDITGAVTASSFDPIGWVLVKAVKSVLAGASAVKRSVKEIAAMVKTIREGIEKTRVADEQEALRRKAREHDFKLKGSADNKPPKR